MAIVSALVAVSLLAGAVQDIKENQVSDYTWIPAIFGALAMTYLNLGNYIFLALKIFMIAIILVIGYFFGGGLADVIGLAIIVIDDDPFAPIGTLVIFVVATLPYAAFRILIRKERKSILPLNEFIKKKNVYPIKLIVEGKEQKLPRTVDKAYEMFEALLKENREAFVEVETGLPAIVPMCIGYLLNMIISFYIGEPWIKILFSIVTT